MRMRSVQAKTYLWFLPVLVVVFSFVSIVVYVQVKQSLTTQLDSEINAGLQSMSSQIEKSLIGHTRLPEVVAKSIEDSYQKLTLEEYRSMVTHSLDANADTFGLGVFFAEGAYRSDQRYFSTYAYRTKDGVLTTEEYSNPSYDYLKQDWYKAAVGQKGVVLTAPYYDKQTQVTMITAAVPMTDGKGEFIGVATADINLTQLQTEIGSMGVRQTGYAFLIDKEGTYLAGRYKDKVMKEKLQADADPAIAALGSAMLKTKQGPVVFEPASGSEQRVYYQEVPGTGGWILAVAVPTREIITPIRDLLSVIAIVAGIGIVFMAVAIFVFTRSISKQIARVKQLSDYLAEGDFTHRIQVRTHDEFGQMGRHFNETIDTLGSVLSRITEHAGTVSVTSKELAAGADQTGRAAEMIAESIQEVATGADAQLRETVDSARATEELALGIGRIAESALLVKDASTAATRQAADGNRIVEETIQEMDLVNRQVQVTAEQMDRLDGLSQEIGAIVGLIGEISSRTNLLALNAGIEAARAGEHGRSFAVVAQEIRKLAEQSKDAAKQVGEMIVQIQQHSGEATKSAETSFTQMEEGMKRLVQAGEKFGLIRGQVESMDLQIQEVSAASEQLSASSEEISATVMRLESIARSSSENAQNVAAASEEQLASMEEIASSTEALRKIAEELTSLLSRYKL
jgi:methyl-accepting chemotaxis protein